MKHLFLTVLPFLLLLTAACSNRPVETIVIERVTEPPSDMDDNPFFTESTLPLQAPDFDEIRMDDYLPAFEEGMNQQLQEVDAIVDNYSEPTFENTIEALERSGQLLTRVQRVFYNMSSAHTNDDIQKLQAELAPRLANHSDNILLNRELFGRVETLYENRDELELDQESLKLLEEQHLSFVRAGARLSEEEQERIREINGELSSLTTEFQERLLAMTHERAVHVESEEELQGLGEERIAAAREAAQERGYDSGYLLTITNTTRQPILSSLENRDLRQRVWEASAYRGIGEGGGVDSRDLILDLVSLRAEKAELLGYENWASYALEQQTAGDPEAALAMINDLIPPVKANTEREAEQIREMMAEDGVDGELQPWDWEYYAERVRQARYEFNEDEVRNYFELDTVIQNGVFYTMNQLYGITFEEREDLPVYHPDVRTFDVFDEDGTQLGLFYLDLFERSSKRGGAWMSSFVVQNHMLDQKPVVLNVLNIPKPASGEPALISFDNVTTLFHEMGHAVHGLFSDVTWPSLSGTAVPRDFVEFPSTFHEDWAIRPDVLENYAIHHQTGDQIPEELLERVIAAREFNQGFDTQEYLGATVVDMSWHLLESDEIPDDVASFESESLERFGLDNPVVPPRYKSPYFSHIFAGGYSASYYAYIWSEVLAADAFAFMLDQGGLTQENGDHFRDTILSEGGTRDAMELYLDFRGQQPDVRHLLQRRGLDVDADSEISRTERP